MITNNLHRVAKLKTDPGSEGMKEEILLESKYEQKIVFSKSHTLLLFEFIGS